MLVLASTSRYRRELLSRLRLQFTTFAPNIDESPAGGESPERTALRLAAAKAQAAVRAFPDALIIGSDQVAELDAQRRLVFQRHGAGAAITQVIQTGGA